MKYLYYFLILSSSTSYCQPNCKVFELAGDSVCYQACHHAWKAIEYDQGSALSQLHFDTAISLCPTLDYAYSEKSVPYLKRGDFVAWRKLVDRAVQIDPRSNLGNRGWCRYQFLRDYRGAIEDIEKLDRLIDYDLGYSTNGSYHLQLVRALSYHGLGQISKAIQIAEDLFNREGYSPGLLDYLHLACMYLQQGNYPEARSCLSKQLEINPKLAENHFYSSQIFKALGDKQQAKEQLFLAEQLYVQGFMVQDPYTHPPDKIYLQDINQAITDIENE